MDNIQVLNTAQRSEMTPNKFLCTEQRGGEKVVGNGQRDEERSAVVAFFAWTGTCFHMPGLANRTWHNILLREMKEEIRKLSLI